jgi:hypothetical protein
MENKELQKLRKEFIRLIDGGDVSANYDMINVLNECLFNIINVHGKENHKNKQEAEAKIIMQMIFSKLLSLRKMLEGVAYQSRDGVKLNTVIDPVVVAGLVRTIYETTAMFNVVYIIPQTPEEKDILNKMWVIAGLRYRQRFTPAVTTPENKKKQAEEAIVIDALTNEILQMPLFKSLSTAGANTIKDLLKKKDYKVKIAGSDATSLSWDAVMPEMNMNKDKMGMMYTYFSLYAHPSNVAVFQYADLFDIKDEPFIRMSNFNTLAGIKLVSFFIASYIKLFPNTLKIFEMLPIIDQCVINFHYKSINEDQSTINDALDVLG